MVDVLTFVRDLSGHSSARIALVIVVLWLVRLIVERFIGKIISEVIQSHHYRSKHEEKQREQTLTNIFTTATTVILWIIAILYILSEFGINLAAIATGAGLVGIVVGFGAQNMIKDWLSGMFIILENQYRIGDVVTIGGHSGLVEHISIRMTKLRDLDGSVYFVPNGQVTTVQNMTLGYSGVLIDVLVSYDTDVNEAEKIINQVGKDLAKATEWEGRIVEPITFLRIDSFGEYGVNLKAVGKTTPMEQWNVAGEYRKRLKKAFEHHHIEIPLPQRVIHERKTK